MDQIAEELIRLAAFADLYGACNSEAGKYIADQFVVRIIKPGRSLKARIE